MFWAVISGISGISGPGKLLSRFLLNFLLASIAECLVSIFSTGSRPYLASRGLEAGEEFISIMTLTLGTGAKRVFRFMF